MYIKPIFYNKYWETPQIVWINNYSGGLRKKMEETENLEGREKNTMISNSKNLSSLVQEFSGWLGTLCIAHT